MTHAAPEATPSNAGAEKSTAGVDQSAPDEKPVPHVDDHDNHGQSTAAWTAVAVILAGTIIMSLAVVFPSVFWFVVGSAVVVLGAFLGKVLSMMGYGAKAGTKAGANGENGDPPADLPGRNQHDSGTA